VTTDRGAAFVTGAGSGLGRAIANRLAQDGFAVVVSDIDSESAQMVAKEIEAAGGIAAASVCDVSDRLSVEKAWAEAVEMFGSVPVLINNAGYDRPSFFLDSDPDVWRGLIEVNLMGVLNCTFVASPHISQLSAESSNGRIVNIASDAGRVGSMGEAVYSAAKGGVIAFSKSMARELARARVTVNAVCPGPADTPMTDGIKKESPIGEKMMGGLLAVTPLKRLAKAEEVAGAVSYFVSAEAEFVTGQVLSVSGGLTMAG
jgi:2-hydroxycyclohexanecarboxyl-CoA dehydrogenase